jgi:hypothetical protein
LYEEENDSMIVILIQLDLQHSGFMLKSLALENMGGVSPLA